MRCLRALVVVVVVVVVVDLFYDKLPLPKKKKNISSHPRNIWLKGWICCLQSQQNPTCQTVKTAKGRLCGAFVLRLDLRSLEVMGGSQMLDEHHWTNEWQEHDDVAHLANSGTTRGWFFCSGCCFKKKLYHLRTPSGEWGNQPWGSTPWLLTSAHTPCQEAPFSPAQVHTHLAERIPGCRTKLLRKKRWIHKKQEQCCYYYYN